MKFVETVIELNVYGSEFKVRFPNMGELSAFESEASKKNVNEIELLLNFLDTLGLPKETSKKMEPDHVRQVMELFKGKPS